MILQSFLAIKAGLTGVGRSTIVADRKKGIGHADLFFAIAHLAYNFPVAQSRLRSAQAIGVSHGSPKANRGVTKPPSTPTTTKRSTLLGVSKGSKPKSA